jgi:cell wall-associated NlpC family hydrolase
VANIGGWGSSYGKHVILKVGSRRYGYGHLSKIKIHNGQLVRSGQILGYVGDTGRAFGYHLHLELRVSPYKYGRDSRNPIPTLGKRISYTRKIKLGSSSAPSSGSSNSRTAADFVGIALRQRGDRYVFGAPRRTSGDPDAFDCSSLVYYCLAKVGIHGVPMSTHGQQPYFQRKGGRISIEKAYKTRGALLYRMGGDFNHVAISLGNGRTIEAMNSRVGVVVASARGRRWTHAYKVPGLRY